MDELLAEQDTRRAGGRGHWGCACESLKELPCLLSFPLSVFLSAIMWAALFWSILQAWTLLQDPGQCGRVTDLQGTCSHLPRLLQHLSSHRQTGLGDLLPEFHLHCQSQIILPRLHCYWCHISLRVLEFKITYITMLIFISASRKAFVTSLCRANQPRREVRRRERS